MIFLKRPIIKWLSIAGVFTLGLVIILLSSNQETLSKKVLQDFTCPQNMEDECKRLEKFEEKFVQLPNQPGFKKQDLLYPAQALALSYARLGNVYKAEKYFENSLGIQGPGGNTHTSQDVEAVRLGRIIEQYIYNKKYDDMFRILKKDHVNPLVCSSAVQLLAYEKEFKLLKDVLRKTDCSASGISYICRRLEKNEITDLFKATVPKYRFNAEKQAALDSQVVRCLDIVARKERNEGRIPTLSGLLNVINTSDKNIHDRLRAGLFYIYERMERLDLAEEVFNEITDKKIKQVEVRRLVLNLTSKNEIKAVEYYKSYKSPYASSIAGLPTEVAFLLLQGINSPKERLRSLTRFLTTLSLNKDIRYNKEYKHLSSLCAELSFEQCVFTEIKETYEAAWAKDHQDKFNYLKANALIGNYEYLRSYKKKMSPRDNAFRLANKSVAEHNADCGEYFKPQIQRAIEEGAFSFGYNSELLSTCLVTNNKVMDLFSMGELKELSPLQKSLVRNLKVSLSNHQNGIEYLSLLNTNAPFNLKKTIIFQTLNKIEKTPESISDKDKREILLTLIDFLSEKTHYDVTIMGRLSEILEKFKITGVPENPFIDLEVRENKNTIKRKDKHKTKELDQKSFARKFNRESIEIIKNIEDQHSFKPYQPRPVWIHTL